MGNFKNHTFCQSLLSMMERCFLVVIKQCMIYCFSFSKDLGGTPSKAAEVITTLYE